MQHWKLILAYDGTHFNGWQIQPRLPTIQGTLAQALYHLTGETVLPQGSGRTDAGVHALAQVASFAIAAPIPPTNLLRALNRSLPRSIRILSATHAPTYFHARHAALSKTYEYRIFPALPHDQSSVREARSICSPMLAPYVWDCPWPISLSLMQAASLHIEGTHDFASFAASDPDRNTRHPEPAAEPDIPSFVPEASNSHRHKSETVMLTQASHTVHTSNIAEAPTTDLDDSRSVILREVEEPASSPHPSLDPGTTRTIHQATWHRSPEGLLLFRITGTGFLHHMVRNLVGTFVDIGAGRTLPEAIPQIVAARNRTAAGPTAPARGLFLVEVHYS